MKGLPILLCEKAMEGKPLPLQLTLEDQVVLFSELTIFSLNLPVKMYFEPFVEDNGNIRLEQSSLEVGDLNFLPKPY